MVVRDSFLGMRAVCVVARRRVAEEGMKVWPSSQKEWTKSVTCG